jgi:hypothetical protein
MEIKINIETLKKRKLFVATPMYGGQCAGMYTKSISDLTAFCAKHDIPVQLHFLFNESLITRARNYCVDEFLRSDAEHLMFIDSDIGFNVHDVIALMALQANDEETYDIIGGPYPKKCISWEKVKMAVDKGVADEDPSVLEKYVGDYVFNPKGGSQTITISEPDHVRTEQFDGSREILMAFQAEIDPKSKRYLSEDYFFCQKAQEIGLKVWFCPWIPLQHVGSYIFGGSLADLASIGANATADPKSLNKKKEKKKNN